MTSIDRIHKTLGMQFESFDVMERKLIVFNKRRQERQFHGKNHRKMFDDVIEKNMKAMQIIARLKQVQIDNGRRKAIVNAKKGFNPFMSKLQNMRRMTQL